MSNWSYQEISNSYQGHFSSVAVDVEDVDREID